MLFVTDFPNSAKPFLQEFYKNKKEKVATNSDMNHVAVNLIRLASISHFFLEEISF